MHANVFITFLVGEKPVKPFRHLSVPVTKFALLSCIILSHLSVLKLEKDKYSIDIGVLMHCKKITTLYLYI